MRSSSTTHHQLFASRKVVCKKTKDELYQKVSLTPRVPRVVLKSNAQTGPRSTWTRCKSILWPTERIKFSLRNGAQHRGLHNSWCTSFCSWTAGYTSQRQSPKVDWEVSSTTGTKNPSFMTSSRRRRLTSSAKNRRSSSLTWTTPRSSSFAKHLQNSNALIPIYGRCFRISQSAKEVDKSNNDVVSILGYVIKKNNKRGARHGPSERQRKYYKAQELLHKAGQKKHGGHSSILARCHKDYEYINSLSLVGWTEQDIILYDIIALENHSYVATRAERIRNSEHWILKLNQDSPQQPINQRPDFAHAKRECKKIHDEYMTMTQQEFWTILHSQQVRQRKEQAFEGFGEYDFAVDPRTGWRFDKLAHGNLSLSSPSSSSANTGTATSGRREVGIPGILRSDNSWFFQF